MAGQIEVRRTASATIARSRPPWLRWSFHVERGAPAGLAAAVALAALAALVTPAPANTVAGAVAGLPRLGLYLAAAVILALTTVPAAWAAAPAKATRPGPARLALGGAGIALALSGAVLLWRDAADPLG